MSELLYRISGPEGQILLFIQNHLRFEFLNPYVIGITNLGKWGLFWIIVSLILLIIPKTRRIGLVSALALVTVFLINNMWLKPLIDRARPYELIEGLVCIIPAENDASFPSGHTAVAMACGTAIMRTAKKWWGHVLFILAVLISLSRLYVGIHFPTDVIAAAIIGMAVGTFWYLLLGRKDYKERNKRARKIKRRRRR